MELSFCTDWVDPVTNAIMDQSELSDALIGLYDPVDYSIDSLFDCQPDLLNLEYYDCTPFNFAAPPPPPPPLPSFPPPLPPLPTITKTTSQLITSFSDPSIHSFHHNYDSCLPCPKRPKSCSNMFTFDPGHNGKVNQRARTLSPQSVAARERRRKISERTHELGKLVPGGTKLNTAEMFHAAFDYVKFLQAQVGILSLMSTFKEGMEGGRMMKKLLESSAVQEKLYGEGKCVVPVEMVGELVKDGQIESNKGVKRDLEKFAGTIGL